VSRDPLSAGAPVLERGDLEAHRPPVRPRQQTALANTYIGSYKDPMLDPAKRPRAPHRLIAGFAALAAIASVAFAFSVAEAKRDARVVNLVRPICEHTGLSHVALERLVRMERNAATNQSHAVQAITAYCLASR
jgi:hypothetical protein